MTRDVPPGALTVDHVTEWLPAKRLSIAYIPELLDQGVDRITIQIGTVTGDQDGQWITTLYVGDAEKDVMHAVGYDVEADAWVGVATWVGDEYNPDDAEEKVTSWVDEHYPDSTFSKLE